MLVDPGCQLDGFGSPPARAGRLVAGERRRGLAEEALRGGLGAVDAGRELDDVQIELEDPPLGEVLLERPGEQRLLQLAQGIARRREPEILRQLLREGRGAARHLPLLPGLLHRLLQLLDGKAVVREEVDVLRHQHRQLELGRDARIGHRPPGDLVALAGLLLAFAVALDERGALRHLVCQARDVGPGGGLVKKKAKDQ